MASTKQAAQVLNLSIARVKQLTVVVDENASDEEIEALISEGKLPAIRRHGRRGKQGRGTLVYDEGILARFKDVYNPKVGRPRKTPDEVLQHYGFSTST